MHASSCAVGSERYALGRLLAILGCIICNSCERACVSLSGTTVGPTPLYIDRQD